MKIGFIGCGNMGSAMISGMLKKGLYKKDEIIVSNLTEEGSKRSKEKLGVVTTLDNREVVKSTKLFFLAVKPQFYEEVLNEVKDELTPEHTVVGIAPGKTLAWLEEKCGQPLKVVRMMPNTPAQVGEGMTGVCANEKVSAEELDQKLAQRVRKIRKRPSISQMKLASVSGVSYGSIKRFETTGQISLLSLTKLAMALELADELRDLFTQVPYRNIQEVINESKGKS